jgi:hypothetical protein
VHPGGPARAVSRAHRPGRPRARGRAGASATGTAAHDKPRRAERGGGARVRRRRAPRAGPGQLRVQRPQVLGRGSTRHGGGAG